jgi:hypothetical protein
LLVVLACRCVQRGDEVNGYTRATIITDAPVSILMPLLSIVDAQPDAARKFGVRLRYNVLKPARLRSRHVTFAVLL